MKSSMAHLVSFLAIVVALVAGPSWALNLTIDRVSGHYSGDGGEFTLFGTPYDIYYASVATASKGGLLGIESFCLEKDEYVSIPGTYAYVVSGAANAGGAGGPSPDPLSWGTAWLYSQFAAGSLAGYNYTPGSGRVASAGKLQQAIWWLEEEITLSSAQIAANPFLQAVGGQFGSEQLAKADASAGAIGVYALNLTDPKSGGRKQDQLVRIPDGGITAMLLGLALLALRQTRRMTAA